MNNESNKQQQRLNVYLQEYSKLKDEQTQRIGFRDNLLYVTLVAFGAILSFALSQKASEVASKAASDLANNTNYYALLVFPWVCLILGWAYLINDQKISAIGEYIRETLRKEVNQESGKADTDKLTFGWEFAHRSDKRRKRRKIEQLIIDEIAFVLSGMIALSAFWILVPTPPLIIFILSGIEFVLLLILGGEILIYADLKVERSLQDDSTK